MDEQGAGAIAPVGMGSEAEVAAGTIVVQMGEHRLALRTRKIKDARPWKLAMAEALGVQLASFDVPGKGGGDTMAALFAMQNVASEQLLSLVLEYDLNGDLGGREWVEANADDEDVYRTFRAILNRHFPFVRDALGAMRELTKLLAEGATVPAQTPAAPMTISSPPAPLRNGRSRTGTSTAPTSSEGSTKPR